MTPGPEDDDEVRDPDAYNEGDDDCPLCEAKPGTCGHLIAELDVTKRPLLIDARCRLVI